MYTSRLKKDQNFFEKLKENLDRNIPDWLYKYITGAGLFGFLQQQKNKIKIECSFFKCSIRLVLVAARIRYWIRAWEPFMFYMISFFWLRTKEWFGCTISSNSHYNNNNLWKIRRKKRNFNLMEHDALNFWFPNFEIWRKCQATSHINKIIILFSSLNFI